MNDLAGRVRFGPFELDRASLELFRDESRVHLAPQPAKLLALLLERKGAVVSREEIRDHVWAGLIYLLVDPRLDSLRDQPNFQKLMDRLRGVLDPA